MSDPEEKATSVFVSYSHRDQKWLERLRVHLRPLVREGDIDLWDDTRIQPGANWKAEIDRALASARVAVFLVSPDFLASDFIHDQELPVLLEAAEKRGTRILPVILSHCLYADSRLGRFQAINSPDRPLEGLPKAGRDKALSDLARAIAAGLSADAPASASAEPKPTPSRKGAGGARKNAPSPSPQNRHAEHQSLATWVFGGLLVLFLEVPVSVETDFARYMSERSDLLHRRLDEVHRLIDTGELNTVEITRDGFSIKPYRGAPIPDAATAFVDRVNAAMPRIKITDLLVGYFCTTPRKGAFQPSYQEIIREHQPGGPGLRS